MSVILFVLQLLFGNAVETNATIALGHAYVESRLDTLAVSRVVAGRRQTGHWSGAFPASFSGPYFCGQWQVEVYDESTCHNLQANVLQSWLQRRDELTQWLAFCHGNFTCALSGYGCGVAGARDPSSCGVYKPGDMTYAQRVLWAADHLKQLPEIGT